MLTGSVSQMKVLLAEQGGGTGARAWSSSAPPFSGSTGSSIWMSKLSTFIWSWEPPSRNVHTQLSSSLVNLNSVSCGNRLSRWRPQSLSWADMTMGEQVKGGKKECQEENTAGSKDCSVNWESYQWNTVCTVISERFGCTHELEPRRTSWDYLTRIRFNHCHPLSCSKRIINFLMHPAGNSAFINYELPLPTTNKIIFWWAKWFPAWEPRFLLL